MVSVIEDPSSGISNTLIYPSVLFPEYARSTLSLSMGIMEFQNPKEEECVIWATFVIVLPSSGMVNVVICPVLPVV